MRRRCLAWVMAGLAVWVGMAGVTLAQEKQKKDKSDDLFDRRKLWTARIKLSNEAWEKLQPEKQNRNVPGAPVGVGGWQGWQQLGEEMRRRAAATQPAKAGEKAVKPEVVPPATVPAEPERKSKAPPATQAVELGKRQRPNYAGLMFPYVRATFEFDGKAYEDVAVRYKGQASYSSAQKSPKKPFKIDFDRAVEGGDFKGLDKVNLHNNTWDPSQIREAFSYWAYREAGVPAPRTTFVLLYLDVEGQAEQCLGLYTMVEEPDDNDFLKRHFGTKNGTMLKPEGQEVSYLGEQWQLYAARLGAKGTPSDAEAKAFVRYAYLVYKAEDAEFRKEIESVLDVDGFLRQLAVSVLLAHMDSPLANTHNYLMYIHPDKHQVHWLPWDMNLSLGAYQTAGRSEELMDLSIDRPYVRDGKLIERLLAVPEFKAAYHKQMKTFTTTFFSAGVAGAEAEAMQRIVAEADRLGAGQIKGGSPNAHPTTVLWWKPPEPKEFVARRVESVTEQLAGRSKGYVPRWRHGGALGGGRRNNPQREASVVMPEGLVRDAFEVVDSDNDQRVTEEELSTAVGRWFALADPDGNGVAAEEGVKEALKKTLPKAVVDAAATTPQAEAVPELGAKARPDREAAEAARRARDEALAVEARLAATKPAAAEVKQPATQPANGVMQELAALKEAQRKLAAEARAAERRAAEAVRPGVRGRGPRNVDKVTGLTRLILHESDRDLDGQVTAAEWQRTARRLHDEGDTAEDGGWDRAEFESAMSWLWRSADQQR